MREREHARNGRTRAGHAINSSQGKPPLRVGVHRPPQQAVEQNDESGHHGNT